MRREWIPTPVFLPGKSHGQRILVATSRFNTSPTYMNVKKKKNVFSSTFWISVKTASWHVPTVGFITNAPPENKPQPTPVFLPGKSHEQRSLAGYSPWGHKESDTPERLSLHFTSRYPIPSLPLHLHRSHPGSGLITSCLN